MKKVLLLLLILIITISISESSYAENNGISTSKSKDIEQLIDLVMTDAFVETWVSGFMRVFTDVASAGRTTEDKEVVAIIGESVERVVLDEYPTLKKQFIPLYDEYFTHEEIKEVLKFYKEPIGQKCIKVMPILTQRGMELGEQWGASLAPKINADLRKKGLNLE